MSDVDQGLHNKYKMHIVCHPNTVPSAKVKKESYLPDVWRVSAGASRTALDRAAAEPEWEAEAETVCSLQEMACQSDMLL